MKSVLLMCALLLVIATPAGAGTGYLHSKDAQQAARQYGRSTQHQEPAAVRCYRRMERFFRCAVDYASVDVGGQQWQLTERTSVSLRRGRISVRGL